MTVPYDSVSYTTGSSDFELAAGVITVKRAMLALVSYHVSVDIASGTDRTVCRLNLQRAALGSSFVNVNGAASFLYNRQNTEGEGSASVSQIIEFSANDQLRVRAQKADDSNSTVQTIADACSFTLLEL